MTIPITGDILTDVLTLLAIAWVGGRFKELLETDVVAVFKMLKAAYDTLEEWSLRGEEE